MPVVDDVMDSVFLECDLLCELYHYARTVLEMGGVNASR